MLCNSKEVRYTKVLYVPEVRYIVCDRVKRKRQHLRLCRLNVTWFFLNSFCRFAQHGIFVNFIGSRKMARYCSKIGNDRLMSVAASLAIPPSSLVVNSKIYEKVSRRIYNYD